MALIDCPECGQQVSTKARACPNCGAPPVEEPEESHYLPQAAPPRRNVPGQPTPRAAAPAQPNPPPQPTQQVNVQIQHPSKIEVELKRKKQGIGCGTLIVILIVIIAIYNCSQTY